MGSMDSLTWQALTAVLTLGGLAGAAWLWRRRGPVAGLRLLALALLPAAAYLTGTLRLLWQIGDAVTSWALRLTFSPTVWVGVGLAAVSVLLLTVTGALRRHGRGGRPAALTRERSSTAARPSTSERPPVPARGDSTSGRGPAEREDVDDLADVEAILRRHGIS